MATNGFQKSIPLSQTVKFIVDNRGKTAPTAPTGIPLIATNCVTNDHLYPLREKLRFVSQETYDTWFRAHPQAGDILLTNKGSQNGAICLVPDPVDFVIAQDMVALRPDEEVIDPLYLFAALRSPVVQQGIKNLDVSGVIPHFKKTDFDKLMLPYPDRYTQQRIGRIYFEMCSKIEMNQRTNETLEGIARAIFKSWFVDFELVGAKTAGAGMPRVAAEVLDLFPSSSSFRNGLPAGWQWKPLSAICEINSRVLRNVEPEYELEYVDIGSAGRGRVLKTQLFRFADAPSRARRLAMDGDTVVSTVRPGNRAYFFVVNPPKNLVVSTGYAVLTPQPNARALTYLNVTSDETIDRLDQIANGGAYPAVTQEQVASIEVVWPGEQLAIAFERIVNPLLSKIAANENASRILASLRDALLPKLVSGEICFKTCEKQVEAQV